MTAKYQVKCVLCKKYFLPSTGNKKYCFNCMPSKVKKKKEVKVEIVEIEKEITREDLKQKYQELWKSKRKTHFRTF